MTKNCLPKIDIMALDSTKPMIPLSKKDYKNPKSPRSILKTWSFFTKINLPIKSCETASVNLRRQQFEKLQKSVLTSRSHCHRAELYFAVCSVNDTTNSATSK